MGEVQEEIMAGYKLTKLGWVPVDWDIGLLKNLSSKITVGIATEVRPHVVEEGIPIIRNQNIRENHFDDSDIIYISEKFDLDNKNKRVESGDVLIVRTGSNTGQACLVPPHFNNAQTFTTLIVRTNGKLSSEYLSLHVNSFGIREVERLAAGGGKPNLNAGFLKQYRIQLPPLPEQRAIAKVLSTWDKAVESLTQLITEKQQKKKALMQQLLTGKKRFPGFDGEWEEYSYKELLKEVKRPVKWDDNELYHLVSVRRRSGGLFERDSLFGHQILTKNLRTAKVGDFLISKMQILHGASAVVTEEFDDKKISGSYIAVRSRDKKVLDINFLDWYSKMPYFYHQTYISSYGVHIEKMTFDFKSFLKLEMKVPGLKEQQKIVATLESAENEINILNQKLDAIKDQKKGLMQQLLTGKKRLKLTET